MQIGLFIRRELITWARRGTVFPERVAAVIVVVALVAGCVLFWDRLGWERTTIAGAAQFGLSTFGLLMVIQTVLAMALAGRSSIAVERECKSLDSLLATRLSSAEITLGMMAAGLVRSANWLAAALPVAIVVAIAGGIQPLLVLLTLFGLGSSVLTAVAVTAVVSIYAPNRARATAVGAGLVVCWLDIPIISEFLQPRVWPSIPGWLLHALHGVVDSSPAGVGTGAFLPVLVPRPFGLIEAIWRMIAIQLFLGALLILWAIAQLRPASRALYDGDWPAHTRWIWRSDPAPAAAAPATWRGSYSLERAPLAARVELGRPDRGLDWASDRNGRGRAGHIVVRASRPSPSWPSAVTVQRARDSPHRKSTRLPACLSASCSYPPAARLPDRPVSSSPWPSASSRRSSSCSTSRWCAAPQPWAPSTSANVTPGTA